MLALHDSNHLWTWCPLVLTVVAQIINRFWTRTDPRRQNPFIISDSWYFNLISIMRLFSVFWLQISSVYRTVRVCRKPRQTPPHAPTLHHFGFSPSRSVPTMVFPTTARKHWVAQNRTKGPHVFCTGHDVPFRELLGLWNEINSRNTIEKTGSDNAEGLQKFSLDLTLIAKNLYRTLQVVEILPRNPIRLDS